MFFLLPIGHDQPVYDRPWLTIGLILLCSGIYLGSCSIEVGANQQLYAAANEIDAVSARYPNARVSFTVDGLPAQVDNIIAPLVDTDPNRRQVPGDAELERAMLDLVSAMNRNPVLRFGYRPGAPTITGAIGHMFMHGGLFHLLGNMLFLWVAGGLLECFWKRWAYVLLYFVSGFAGLAAHHLSGPHSLAPLVGASGAIAGLIGAFVVSYPRSRIKIGYLAWFFRFFVGSFFVPAWIVIPMWGISELLHALFAPGDGVAYWAHVGGFACGILAGVVGRLMGWVAIDAGYDPGYDGIREGPPPRERTEAEPIPVPDLPDPPPRVPPGPGSP